MAECEGLQLERPFCRLVAKTARQFGKAVEAVCAPFQFALSTRAGTDCVGHAVQSHDRCQPRVYGPLDGVGALRSSFLSNFAQCPQSPRFVAFCEVHLRPNHDVRGKTAQESDTGSNKRKAVGIHDSLCEVRNRLRPDDTLFAHLDDVHVSSPPNRTRDGYNLLEHQLFGRGWDPTPHGQNSRVESCRDMPPGSGRFGRRRLEPRWHQDLVPIGSPEFVHSFIEKRLGDEGRLWKAVTWVPRSPKRVANSSTVCWGHVATTCFAHCPRVIPQNMLPATTTACGRPRGRFWEDSRARRKIR